MATTNKGGRVLEASGQACKHCPWRQSNQGKPSALVEGETYQWFSAENLGRLWGGLRCGERMTCHPTDPRHPGKSAATPGRFRVLESEDGHEPDALECAGALVVVQREMHLLQELIMEADAAGDDPGTALERYHQQRPEGLTRDGVMACFSRLIVFPGETPMARPDLNDADIFHPGLPWVPISETPPDGAQEAKSP